MKRVLFGLTALGLLALAGAGAGLKTQDFIETKADAACSGRISVDITGEGWANNSEGQRISVYFFTDENEDGAAEKEGWGSLEFAAQYEYVVFVNYSLNFVPAKMKAVRYSPYYGDDAGEWDIDKWAKNDGHDWGKWNEGENLDFSPNSNIVVAGTGYSFVGYPYEEGKPKGSDWVWQRLDDLSSIKKNGSNHIVYYLTKEFVQWEEFGVKIFNNFYGWSVTSLSSFVNKDEWGVEGSNIQYKGEPATFTVSFDRNAGTILINDPVAAADEWALTFLAGVTCDGDGSITKDEWTALSTTYAALDPDVKAIFTAVAEDGNDSGTNVERAVCRYDYIVKKYGTTAKPDFMGRKTAGKINPKATQIVPVMNDGKDSPLIITVTIGAVATISVAGLFFIRRRHAE